MVVYALPDLVIVVACHAFTKFPTLKVEHFIEHGLRAKAKAAGALQGGCRGAHVSGRNKFLEHAQRTMRGIFSML